MSTAFTIDYTNWQELAKIQEIGLAQSERDCAVSDGTPSSGINEGDDIQTVHARQTWLEDNCVNFVDHTQAINGAASIPMFTLASWRSAAGLNASGFQRSTDGISFTYGLTTGGYIIGDWIWDELAKGYSALKWTVRNGDAATDEQYRTATGTPDADCETARNSQIAAWAASSWGADGAKATQYFAESDIDYVGPNLEFSAQRYAAKYGITGIPDFRPHAADLYFYGYSTVSDAFEDIDTLGFEYHKYLYWETFAEAAVTSHAMADYIGYYDGNPVELSAVSGCPSPLVRTVGSEHARWILKWNFTNSN